MTNQATTEHITSEQVANYFEGGLPGDQESLIEEHLADCNACTALARRWHAFSEVFDRWTAQAHGEAYLRAAVERAIKEAIEKERVPALRERLASWCEGWGGLAEAAVRVIFEAPGKAARVVTEGLETVIRPGGLWQFDLAPASIKVLGATRGRRKAAPTVALAQGTSQARVAVTSAISEIEVRVDEWPAGQDPPLVLLVPTQEGGAPRVQEPKRLPGTQSLIARFENVEAGDYLVAFEPLKRASA